MEIARSSSSPLSAMLLSPCRTSDATKPPALRFRRRPRRRWSVEFPPPLFDNVDRQWTEHEVERGRDGGKRGKLVCEHSLPPFPFLPPLFFHFSNHAGGGGGGGEKGSPIIESRIPLFGLSLSLSVRGVRCDIRQCFPLVSQSRKQSAFCQVPIMGDCPTPVVHFFDPQSVRNIRRPSIRSVVLIQA